MLLKFRVNSDVMIEVEEATQKEVFEQLASLQEVFSNTKCGRCGSPAIFAVRNNAGNVFYEMKCTKTDCRAILPMGVHNSKDGTLFPKRYDVGDNEEKKWLPHNGWKIWRDGAWA